MGKYSMTRGRLRASDRQRGSVASPLNDDAVNKLKYLFGDVGIFGIKPVQIYDSYNYMDDYLSNRNMSWSDMRYPSIAPKSVGNAGLWKTSEKALKRLYD